MKRKIIPAVVLAAVCGVVGGYLAWPRLRANGAEAKPKPTEARPARWAQPVTKAGLPNLHKVSDGLYRGAQPSAEGMRELKEMGVKTVVSLRAFHSDRDEIGETSLAYEHIPMKPWHPETEDVVRFLQIVTARDRRPVFVHCQYGADRTGTMCAVYRVFVEGWPKEEAIQEMTQGGFGYHTVWQKLIEFLKELDVDDVKRRAGLLKEPTPRDTPQRSEK